MAKNNMTVDSIIKIHFDNANKIEAPSTSKPENNPSTYAIKGLCDSFFYMKLKIEKSQSLILSEITKLTSLSEKERDNDKLLDLEERSAYHQWSIKNHQMTIDRLSASYEVASGQPWVAPRKRENIVPIRPKFSERKSYDKVVLS